MEDDVAALDRTTKAVIRGELAQEERRAVIMRLWEGGMTQREIAERMTRAARSVGGPEITQNAVWKITNRVRKAAS